MLTLPTTIGSIITYEIYDDTDETGKFTAVATLMAGAIEDGQAHDTVWGDSYIEDADGGVPVERILKGNPTVLFEAAANPEFASLAGGFERNVGETVTYDEPGPAEPSLRLTATLVPGLIGQDGVLMDCYWTNSYGQYVSDETLASSNPAVIVRGATDL